MDLKQSLGTLATIFKPVPRYQPYRLSNEVDSLRNVLPYRYYDHEQQLFINQKSIGFGFELPVLACANEETAESLDALIRDLPEGKTDIQISLYAHNQLNDALAYQREQLSQAGGVFAQLAESANRFEQQGAIAGFKTRDGSHCHLRDLRLFLFVSQPASGYRPDSKQVRALLDCRAAIESKLAAYSPQRLDDQHFLNTLFQWVSPDTQTGRSHPVAFDALDQLHESLTGPNYTLDVSKQGLTIGWEQDKQRIDTEVVTLNVSRWPQSFCLWQGADNFASLLNARHKIACPFLMTMIFRVQSQVRSKAQAQSKYLGLSRQANSPMARFLPGLSEASADWKQLRDELANDSIKVCQAYYGLTLYTTARDSQRRQDEAISSFRANGFELQNVSYQQLPSFLATLPFLSSEHLFEELQFFKRTKRMTSFNLANCLPMIADWKGASTGIAMSTFRDQYYLFDPFYTQTDNANMFVSGATGSGKSFFVQRMICSILSRGGWVFVIDRGHSYRKLCKLLGGTYLEGGSLSLNPFTHLQDEAMSAAVNNGSDATLIANLLAVMASPRQGLTDVQRAELEQAVQHAWQHKKNKATIDTVIEALNHQYEQSQKKTGKGDTRIHDITTLLANYATTGSQGELFNKPSTIDPNARFVVLDLEAFVNDDHLSKCVLMALMMMIRERMYDPKNKLVPKACLIDEAWSFLKGNDEDVKHFIEYGYRTVRKHYGLFCTISQEINTCFDSDIGRVIYNNSDIKVTLKQDLKTFCQQYPDYYTLFEQRVIGTFQKVKEAGYSSMHLSIGNQTLFTRLFADPFARVLFTTEPKQAVRVEQALASGLPLDQAVLSVACQDYPDEMAALGFRYDIH